VIVAENNLRWPKKDNSGWPKALVIESKPGRAGLKSGQKPVPRREKAPRICPAGRDLRAGQHRCIGNFRGFAGFSQMGCLVLQRKKFA